jgi:tetratricopeptide (TPR) repeat protein
MARAGKKGLKSAAAQGSQPVVQKGTPASVWGYLVLVVTGFCIYLPSIRGSWLWDDEEYILRNDLVHSANGFSRVWITLNPLGSDWGGNYYPLSTLVTWLEWHLWGDQTLGYHLVSVALHVASALLLWRLFSRLGLAFAWVGAMLFLVHPLAVESVAWMSELKNTLSLPLFLLAALSWLDYGEKGTMETYRASLLWFALSLAAKTSGLMLPVVFLAYGWWKCGRITPRDLKILSPFFALSLIAGIITLLPPHLATAPLIYQTVWSLGPSLACLGGTIIFLLGKCFVPVGPLPDYPGLEKLNPTAFDLLPWFILVVVGVLLLVGWRRATWSRPAALGLGFFLLNLFPVIFFVAKNYGWMNWSLDHLVYVPVIGLIGWVIAWLELLRQRVGLRAQPAIWAGIGAVLLLFSWGSFSYADVFSSADRFWTYTLEKEPENWRVHYNYAKSLENDAPRFPEAIAEFEKSIALNPSSDLPQFELATILETEGRSAEAKDHFLQAAKLNPHEMRAYLALSELARKAGDLTATETYIRQASTAAPDDPAPLAALAALRMQAGQKKEALDLYEQAVKKDPDQIAFRYNYGVALLQSGMPAPAVEQLQAAVALDENLVSAHQNLGVALAQTGALPQAAEQFGDVVALRPNDANARDNLGLALAQTGHLDDAIEQFQKALELNPRDVNAQKTLTKLISLQTGNPAPDVHP